MSNVIYAIVFKGEIIDGFQPISVKAHMAQLLKADAKKMQVLFSGKQLVIKRTEDKTLAIKYANALKKIGADIKVSIVKAVKPPEPDADTGLSLMPNEGYIVEPTPPVPPPDLDLSAYSVVENDDGFLVEATEQEHLELDLSEYSIKDNDGSPLVEASPDEAHDINVPDFGLDEPGALLETIPDERELLNPNTLGMSLATAGSDLLEPEEKDQSPPPKAPDTSGINLVPSFD